MHLDPLHTISLLPESISHYFLSLSLAPSNILVVLAIQRVLLGWGRIWGWMCDRLQAMQERQVYFHRPNTLPTLFRTTPLISWPPIPPMPSPHPEDAMLLAHFFFASRSLHGKCQSGNVSCSAVGDERWYGRICETNDINHVEHEGKDDNGNEAVCQAR